MRVRLLHACGDDPQGAVLDVDEDRARRLVRVGYAVLVKESPKKAKTEWQPKA